MGIIFHLIWVGKSRAKRSSNKTFSIWERKVDTVPNRYTQLTAIIRVQIAYSRVRYATLRFIFYFFTIPHHLSRFCWHQLHQIQNNFPWKIRDRSNFCFNFFFAFFSDGWQLIVKMCLHYSTLTLNTACTAAAADFWLICWFDRGWFATSNIQVYCCCCCCTLVQVCCVYTCSMIAVQHDILVLVVR